MTDNLELSFRHEKDVCCLEINMLCLAKLQALEPKHFSALVFVRKKRQ